MATPYELYIHIPFCMKKCNYCDFLSGVFDVKMQKAYVAALCTQIRFEATLLKNVELISIYIGGGTPSWLDAADMEIILNTVYDCFSVTGDAEISIECNPGTLSHDKLVTYRHIGIDRISIGLQSANNDELKELGRVHDYNRFLYTYDAVRKAGFNNVNVDIMTGLPYQTLDKLHHTLNSVVMLRPEHISAYSLIIEKGTPFYRKYRFDDVKQRAGMETEALPSEELSYQLYRHTIDFLTGKGYERYEISNYARPGFACRHNVGYWKRVPYLGVGLGAASLINNCRSSNITDIYKYIEIADKLNKQEFIDCDFCSPFYATFEKLSRSDAMAEFMYLGLRQIQGVYRSDFAEMFNCDIEGVYGGIMAALKEKQLLDASEGRIFLTDIGIDVSNQVLPYFLLD
ncbi:MAG: radical SAM family heme chaperone HemW [Pseudobutyrivibrio sp.]|nr:radical SAM family heme chaperone HemW [Pseudobutyrivibrio sp.]